MAVRAKRTLFVPIMSLLFVLVLWTTFATLTRDKNSSQRGLESISSSCTEENSTSLTATKVARSSNDQTAPPDLTKKSLISFSVETINRFGIPQPNIPLKAFASDSGELKTLWAGISNSAGIAAVDIAIDSYVEGRTIVAANVLQKTPPQVVLERARLSGYTIILDEMGSVRISFFTHDHIPFLNGVLLTLFDLESSPTKPWPNGILDATCQKSVFYIENVPCGKRYALHARSEDGDGERASMEFEGPRNGGDVVNLEIVLSPRYPTIRMRIVDAQGVPYIKRRVAFRLVGSISGDTYSDDKGFVELQQQYEGNVGDTWKFRISLWPQKDASLQEVLTGSAFPTGSGKITNIGDNDLYIYGDLTLEMPREKEIVSGIVTDGRGTPVNSAGVMLIDVSDETIADSGRNPRILQTNPNVTDKHGRFALRFEIPRSGAWIVPFKSGYYASGIQIIYAPTKNARVTLSEAGQICGSVSLDDPSLLRHLFVRLDLPTPNVPYRHSGELTAQAFDKGLHWKRLDESGVFRFEDLVPGSRDLTISLPGGTEVKRIDDILVSAGRVSEDPRLSNIDLRGSVTEICVTVVDAESRPVVDIQAQAIESSQGGVSFPAVDHFGRMRLVIRPEDTMKVFFNKYFPVELRKGDHQKTIHLVDAAKLVVNLPYPISLHNDDLYIRARVWKSDADRIFPRCYPEWQKIAFKRRLVFFISAYGEYNLQFEMCSRSAGNPEAKVVSSQAVDIPLDTHIVMIDWKARIEDIEALSRSFGR